MTLKLSWTPSLRTQKASASSSSAITKLLSSVLTLCRERGSCQDRLSSATQRKSVNQEKTAIRVNHRIVSTMEVSRKVTHTTRTNNKLRRGLRVATTAARVAMEQVAKEWARECLLRRP